MAALHLLIVFYYDFTQGFIFDQYTLRVLKEEIMCQILLNQMIERNMLQCTRLQFSQTRNDC